MSEDAKKNPLTNWLNRLLGRTPSDDSKAAATAEFKRSIKVTGYEKGTGAGIDTMAERLAAEPDSIEIRDWLAFTLYTEERFEEAKVHYLELVKRDPTTSSHSYYLANTYAKLGNREEAVLHWQAVFTQEPDSPLGRKARARYNEAQPKPTK